MNRLFTAAAAFLAVLFCSGLVFAQATKASPTTPSKPLPTSGWVKPIKGLVTVEVIRGATKKVGNEIVTVLRVKNTSAGAIALLKVDEYWYDKKNNVVTGDSRPVRQPINPGQIVEVECRSPYNAEAFQNQYFFSHANGQVKAKVVKKFTE
jgi:hypothetical protein